MSQIQLPECAVCGRPVERLERFERPDTGEIIFDAHCHGQKAYLVTRPIEFEPLRFMPVPKLEASDRADSFAYYAYTSFRIPEPRYFASVDLAVEHRTLRQLWRDLTGPLVGRKTLDRRQRRLDRQSNVRRRKRFAELKRRGGK